MGETEICSKCGCELPSSEQAYVFHGCILCAKCDKTLRQVHQPHQPRPPDTEIQVRQRGPVGVRGWLLLFCISLTIINPLALGASSLPEVWRLVTGTSKILDLVRTTPLGFYFYIDLLVTFGLAVFSPLIGVGLWTRKSDAVHQARTFLECVRWLAIIRYLVLGTILHLPLTDIIQVTCAWLSYSFIWSPYLEKSKRVRATYPGAFR